MAHFEQRDGLQFILFSVLVTGEFLSSSEETESVNIIWNKGIMFKSGKVQSKNLLLALQNAALTSFL